MPLVVSLYPSSLIAAINTMNRTAELEPPSSNAERPRSPSGSGGNALGTEPAPGRTPPRSAPPGPPAIDPASPTNLPYDRLATIVRNLHMMHVLERLAAAFNQADVPVMVLKGAALNLTVYDRPDDRPMDDLDLLVRPEHMEHTRMILTRTMGCSQGRSLVTEDFFPRYHYELEFIRGSILASKIDLHVRPFRPLRYARLVPPDALWSDAVEVRIGSHNLLMPSAEGMLIHLAAHAAIHGCDRPLWLQDLKRWVDHCGRVINWQKFLTEVERWGLALPVRVALDRAQRQWGPICPPEALSRLQEMRVGWRDRLALWHAPRDRQHPTGHVLVSAATTPGRSFVLGYLMALAFPGREHMGEWYAPRHRGWLACAQLCRLCSP